MTTDIHALTPQARSETRARWSQGLPQPERSHDADPLRVACDRCDWSHEGEALAALTQARRHRQTHGFTGDRYTLPKPKAAASTVKCKRADCFESRAPGRYYCGDECRRAARAARKQVHDDGREPVTKPRHGAAGGVKPRKVGSAGEKYVPRIRALLEERGPMRNSDIVAALELEAGTRYATNLVSLAARAAGAETHGRGLNAKWGLRDA